MPFHNAIPKALTPNGVRMHAPPQSGVYGISNAREWIYIGEANNIQLALLHHMEEKDSAMMQRSPAGFVFEICAEQLRPARQDRLVREYEPVCNRGPSRAA